MLPRRSIYESTPQHPPISGCLLIITLFISFFIIFPSFLTIGGFSFLHLQVGVRLTSTLINDIPCFKPPFYFGIFKCTFFEKIFGDETCNAISWSVGEPIMKDNPTLHLNEKKRDVCEIWFLSDA